MKTLQPDNKLEAGSLARMGRMYKISLDCQEIEVSEAYHPW
jgi:hypothetical protein